MLHFLLFLFLWLNLAVIFIFYFSSQSKVSCWSSECSCPLLLPCLFQWRPPVCLCVPAGNTLCKSGSIAVFGNVVYSGLLNDHLWHLGVPLFTRLVRAPSPSVHTYLHFVRRVSCGSLEPKQASGAEFPKVSNGFLLMSALLKCLSWSFILRTGCDSPLLWM